MCPWAFHMSLCSPLTSHEVCGSQSPASQSRRELQGNSFPPHSGNQSAAAPASSPVGFTLALPWGWELRRSPAYPLGFARPAEAEFQTPDPASVTPRGPLSVTCQLSF